MKLQSSYSQQMQRKAKQVTNVINNEKKSQDQKATQERQQHWKPGEEYELDYSDEEKIMAEIEWFNNNYKDFMPDNIIEHKTKDNFLIAEAKETNPMDDKDDWLAELVSKQASRVADSKGTDDKIISKQ